MNKRRISNVLITSALSLGMISSSTITVLGLNNSLTQTNSPESREFVSNYGTKDGTILFNDNWKFHLGDLQGAEKIGYDVSKWSDIQLPHDYSLIQDYIKNGEAESGYKPGGVGWYRKTFTLDGRVANKDLILVFDGAYQDAEVYVNGVKAAFHPYGYTAFAVNISNLVKANEENTIAVKTNNQIPSSRWYSGSGLYRSVYLRTTDKTHIDYNGVVFKTPDLDKKYQNDSDVEVETTIVNNSEKANVKVKASLYERNENGSEGKLVKESDLSSSQTINEKETKIYKTNFKVNKPKLWSVDDANLYVLKVEVFKEQVKIDESKQEVGFRFTSFDKDKGFSLNGKYLKLKGVCMHHDQGGLGAKAYYDAIDRQFKILKDMGVNAVRVTHNPSARAMKDVANRRGIMLIEEAFDTWTNKKNGNTYDNARYFNQEIKDTFNLLGLNNSKTWAEYNIKAMVKNGVNDPSIIMWSLGNEIFELEGGYTNDYPSIADKLIKWADEVDGTRPLTFGDNRLNSESKDNYYNAVSIANKLTNNAKLKGIVGYNYANSSVYEKDYKKYKDWNKYGSETASAVNSRGVYSAKGYNDRPNNQLSSYDQNAVPWGALASKAWYDIIRFDYMAGEFVWTGFDYLGEPTPWNGVRPYQVAQPAPKSSYFGIIDTAGFPKDSYYFYRSQWNDKSTTLHVLPAWNEKMIKKSWNNGNKVEVVVYSNAPKVKLVHVDEQGKETELGTKEFKEINTGIHKYKIDKDNAYSDKGLYFTWYVDYKPGKVKAIALDNEGKEIKDIVGRKEVVTYKEAKKLSINKIADIKNGTNQSLAYVEIDVKDEKGNQVENANNKVDIEVSGPAKLVAMDNGDATDFQSYQDSNRKAFNGKVLAVLKLDGKNGKVKVTAKSTGLESSTFEFNVETSASDEEKTLESYLISKVYYLKKGNEIKLPETIKVRYTDQKEELVKVNWDLTPELKAKLAKGESVDLIGTLDKFNLKVSVKIIVIEKAATMKNYSTATAIGEEPILPKQLSGYLLDGSKLDGIDVTWEKPNKDVYNKKGIVKVKGYASILNEKSEVTATIRVTDKVAKGKTNVALVAANLTQDIPQEYQKDTLKAVNDGKAEVGYHSGEGNNPWLWSNYEYSQKGHKEASIIFGFDTAKSISEVVVHHYTDSYSAMEPKEVRFSWSTGGDDFTSVKGVKVGNSQTKGQVTKTVYKLEQAVPAVKFKLTVVNNDGKQKANYSCTALSEVELISVEEELKMYSNPKLDSIIVNGDKVSEKELEKREIITDAQIAEVETESKENSAITVLPQYNKTIKIISVSEDKSKELVYVIKLDQEIKDKDLEEVDPKTTKATAGSVEPTKGNEVENANDGNENTIWHTHWHKYDKKDFWLTLELQQPTKISGIRYLPRQLGEDNGIVKKYEVYVSENGKDNWVKVANGSWDNSREWKQANFKELIVAKFVKLVGLETYGDGNQDNKFMSAAEFRVIKASSKIELFSKNVTLLKDKFELTSEAIEPEISVIVNQKTLRKGVDYKVTYKDNLQIGTGKVIVQGLGKYAGIVEKTFTIVEAKQPEKPKEPKEPQKPNQPEQPQKPNNPIISYDMLSGETITVDENSNLIVRSAADFSKFVGVEIDDKLVDSKYYTVKSGSTIVEVKNDYLKTLRFGNHKVVILSKDGKAEATFKYIKSQTNFETKPNSKENINKNKHQKHINNTGDNTTFILPIFFILLSMLGLIKYYKKYN